MRISLDKKDPAFNPIWKWCKVWLNGEPLDHCITADDERGEVVIYPQEDGRTKRSMIGTPLREYIRGEVRIEAPLAVLVVKLKDKSVVLRGGDNDEGWKPPTE